MRRRSRGFRRKRKVVRWVLPADYGTRVAFTPGGFNVSELCGNVSGSADVNDPIAVDRFKVEAIAGWISFGRRLGAGQTDTAVCSIGVGIMVVQNDLATAYVPDPHKLNDIPNSWLYLYHRQVEAFNVPVSQNNFDDTFTTVEGVVQRKVPTQDCGMCWEHEVRVKTKRVLRDNQGLYLFASANNAGFAGTISYTAYLRVLISKID